MQYCRIISLDNNNSVKFTSSRENSSTTNDSMVMKIAHAQLHMYKNIMYKFQSCTCKTVGEKLQTKIVSTEQIDRWMDRQTDGQPRHYSSIPPSTSLGGGGGGGGGVYNKDIKKSESFFMMAMTTTIMMPRL